jgi:integrase
LALRPRKPSRQRGQTPGRSFRRAFNTALAEAGVNVQHAMHLAAHSDPKTHMRYVIKTTAMRTTA